MKICKGTGRTAFVGEHFTIKVPRPDIGRAISNLRESTGSGVRGVLECIAGTEGNARSLRFALTRGISENLRERDLSKTEMDILVPTRASILGLVNIQDTARDVDIKNNEIYEAFWKRLVSLPDIRDEDERIIRAGGHTLPQSKNYGLHEGTIKLRDYGERDLKELLTKYGHLLREAILEKTR